MLLSKIYAGACTGLINHWRICGEIFEKSGPNPFSLGDEGTGAEQPGLGKPGQGFPLREEREGYGSNNGGGPYPQSGSF